MLRRHLTLGAVVAAAVVVSSAAPAWARGSRRGRSRYETVELSTLRANPKAFVGKPISFDCFFAGLGRIYQPFQTPFVTEQFLNFHVWEPGTELWDNKARREAFLFCYVPRDLDKQTNYIMRREMYESVRLLGQVRVVYANQPWFEVDGVEPSPMPSISEVSLKHILVGIKSLRNGDFPMAQTSFEEALREGLPLSVQTFAQRELGKAYYELGKYAEAAQALRRAADVVRDDSWILLKWGQSLSRAAKAEKVAKRAVGMLREALTHLEKARKLEPANPDMHAEIGWAKAKKAGLENRPDLIQAALRDVRRALALKPTAPSYHVLALVYIQIGKLADAENALSQAIVHDPLNPRYHQAIADLVYMPQERYRDAESEYALVIRLTQTEPDGYILRAVARRKTDNFDDAIQDYEDALRVDPENLEALLGVAAVYRDRGMYDNARNFLDKAVKLAPRDVKVLVARAEILWAQGAYDEAIGEYEKIKKMKISGPLTMVDYGEAVCLTKKPKPDLRGASKLLGKVVKAEPDFADGRRALAEVYMGIGPFSKAVTELQAVKKLRPGDERSRMLLGEALAEDGKIETAIAEFRELLREKPDYAYAKNYLAYLLADFGKKEDLDEAHTLAQQAHQQEQTNATFQDTLGWVLYRKGEVAEARTHLEMAVLSADQAEPFYHLAVVVKDEDVAVARENVEEALRKLRTKTFKGYLTRKLEADAKKLAKKVGASQNPAPKKSQE